MSKAGKLLYEIGPGNGSPMMEDKGQYLLRGEEEFPVYEEIQSPEELNNTEQIVGSLRAIDWSFTNDDTRFLTHDLHPYPAKFIPQIPGNCIARLSMRGDLILDPFGGSGTTALEAARLGRRAISIDANAIGTLAGIVKTSNIDRTSATELYSIRSALATLLTDLSDAESLCKEYAELIPEIPNIDKWFPITSRGELAAIRSRIMSIESDKAVAIAQLAMSRIVLSASFQDSETRYSSKPREIPQGYTIKRFLFVLDEIVKNVSRTQATIRYGVCKFLTADSRDLTDSLIHPESVDLIVTSPPYGNANDYHLYHRFRLMWLGHDPRKLGKIEIGSHLRHQREDSGFESYLEEMGLSISEMLRLLKKGRYAVLIVGDAIYKKVIYPAANSLSQIAEKIGFETIDIIDREIHKTKRSFVAAGRRATQEKIVILRKASKRVIVWFDKPPYKLWPYEQSIRKREIESVFGTKATEDRSNGLSLKLDASLVTKGRQLVFTHGIGIGESDSEPTWQAIIENGLKQGASGRKNSKYVTHGLHSYKGKFYPQLAKGLLNLAAISPGSRVLDPFCGSGTTILEGYFNGYQSFGCDMNPLAAKIAKAKIGVLDLDPDVVRSVVGTLVSRIDAAPASIDQQLDQFDPEAHDEIQRWFPGPVIFKLNWLLAAIRSVCEGVIRDFLEIVLSNIIREVSQQDTNDLRIRRRKDPIEDADVFQLYLDALENQYARIEKFWSIRGYSPNIFQPWRIIEGDARSMGTFQKLGVGENTIDLVLTSPPYATALPYIDTDRLSLLVLFGMASSTRRPIEHNLIGSREIITKERRQFEEMIAEGVNELVPSVREYLKELQKRVAIAEVGFRRKNMPALLMRFFKDMEIVLKNCHTLLRPGGEAMIVIGDNRIRLGEEYERIATTDYIRDLAIESGFELLETIDISVTTENKVHIKNAITENVVLRLLALPPTKVD